MSIEFDTTTFINLSENRIIDITVIQFFVIFIFILMLLEYFVAIGGITSKN